MIESKDFITPAATALVLILGAVFKFIIDNRKSRLEAKDAEAQHVLQARQQALKEADAEHARQMAREEQRMKFAALEKQFADHQRHVDKSLDTITAHVSELSGLNSKRGDLEGGK